MVKLAGAVMIVGATAAVGAGAVMRLRRRVGLLAALIAAFGMMKSEICSAAAPLRDVMELLAERAETPARPLFQEVCRGMSAIGSLPFSTIWSRAAETVCGELLTAEERESVQSVGGALGHYDAAWQAEAIDRALRRLESFRAEAEAAYRRDARLHAFMGVAAGVFTVILFI